MSSLGDRFRRLLLELQEEPYFLALAFDEPRHDYGSWDPYKPQDLKYPPVASESDFSYEGLPIENGSVTWDRYMFMPGVIPCIKDGKVRPIVEEIGGKIFVLQPTGVFHKVFDNPYPVFEYYDPLVKKLEEIPDAPYVKKTPNGFVGVRYTGVGLFVIGSNLFIPSGVKELYCFDASSMRWDYSCSSNLIASFRKAGLAFPLFGRCVSGLDLADDSHNVIICLQDFGCFRHPRPYAHLIDKTGKLLCSQDLSKTHQLFDDFLPHVLTTVESRFIDLGSGRGCGIIYGQALHGIEVVLHICIFEFQKLPGGIDDIDPTSSPVVKEFLSVRIINKYFYKLTGTVNYRFPSLVNAFIL